MVLSRLQLGAGPAGSRTANSEKKRGGKRGEGRAGSVGRGVCPLTISDAARSQNCDLSYVLMYMSVCNQYM